MMLPTIHLNGTSKERLIEDLCEASHALDSAFEALKRTAPNGRDYYPQGPAALSMAEDEHTDRLRRLDAIKNEIDALTVAIDSISSRDDGGRG
jgi:hypothetical protein